VCVSIDDVQAALADAMSHPGEYERLFDWMQEQLPLTTFAALGPGADEADPQRELRELEAQRAGRAASRDPDYWGLGNVFGPGLRSLG
jgi:hypothetical protein